MAQDNIPGLYHHVPLAQFSVLIRDSNQVHDLPENALINNYKRNILQSTFQSGVWVIFKNHGKIFQKFKHFPAFIRQTFHHPFCVFCECMPMSFPLTFTSICFHASANISLAHIKTIMPILIYFRNLTILTLCSITYYIKLYTITL